MPPDSLVQLPVLVLLAGALVQLLLAPALSARGKGWLAFAFGLGALASVLALWPTTLSGTALDVRLATWDGPVQLAYRVDGLSILFAFMATGIGSAVLLYSIDYMARDPGASRFYALMLVFIAGLVNLVYSADLVLVYLSWEAIGLCSFLLVGFWYQQKDAAYGARKVLVMTHAAGYGLLAAIVILCARSGSTLWTDPKVSSAFGTGVFLLILIAAVGKSVQFPLHTWIPDAMAAPTPVSALLHAACYVKAGVYLVARLHSLGQWPMEWQWLVTWLGTATIIVGILFALVQSDLKRLLAFSTVSQIGYMMLGLGLSTPLGIAAGLLHCLNHGLFKGGLFLCAGAIQHSAGTRDMDKLGGLGRRMPRLTALWLVLAGGIAGVPLLNGFVSKWLIYNAALEAGQPAPALISWFGAILTVFAFLKATSSVFLGEEREASAQAHEAPRLMLAGAGVLAVGTVVVGVAPQLAVTYALNPILLAFGQPQVIGVTWLGLTTGSGSWFATGGLVLALVAVAVGGLVYWLAAPSRRPARALVYAGGGGVFTGGEPLPPTARLSASDFSAIIRHDLSAFYRWMDVDRYYLALWHSLLVACDRLGRVGAWLEARAVPALAVLGVALAALGLAIPAGSAQLPTQATSEGSILLVAVALALLCLLLAGFASRLATARLAGLAAAGSLTLLGLVAGESTLRLLLLEAGAVAALALVWRTSASTQTTWAYAAAVAVSAVGVVGGDLALEAGATQVALALLLAGFAVKLALVPLYLWLPRVAEATPAVVVGLVVAVVDVAAFGELLALRQSAAGLFDPSAVWLTLGLASALGGGLLMLAQRDLKRMLAFSTVEDMGVLLVGLTLGGELGITGATLGVGVHALAKALLFSTLAGVEAEETPTLASRGLASRHPVAGAAFVLGALAVLGVPPTVGYVAHWRLYEAAASASPFLLIGMVVPTILGLLAYSRAIARCWWGEGTVAEQREPALLRAALLAMGVVILAAGLWPSLLAAL